VQLGWSHSAGSAARVRRQQRPPHREGRRPFAATVNRMRAPTFLRPHGQRPHREGVPLLRGGRPWRRGHGVQFWMTRSMNHRVSTNFSCQTPSAPEILFSILENANTAPRSGCPLEGGRTMRMLRDRPRRADRDSTIRKMRFPARAPSSHVLETFHSRRSARRCCWRRPASPSPPTISRADEGRPGAAPCEVQHLGRHPR